MPALNNVRNHETGDKLRLLSAAGYKSKYLAWDVSCVLLTIGEVYQHAPAEQVSMLLLDP